MVWPFKTAAPRAVEKSHVYLPAGGQVRAIQTDDDILAMLGVGTGSDGLPLGERTRAMSQSRSTRYGYAMAAQSHFRRSAKQKRTPKLIICPLMDITQSHGLAELASLKRLPNDRRSPVHASHFRRDTANILIDPCPHIQESVWLGFFPTSAHVKHHAMHVSLHDLLHIISKRRNAEKSKIDLTP